jgi:hypothetical protein
MYGRKKEAARDGVFVWEAGGQHRLRTAGDEERVKDVAYLRAFITRPLLLKQSAPNKEDVISD